MQSGPDSGVKRARLEAPDSDSRGPITSPDGDCSARSEPPVSADSSAQNSAAAADKPARVAASAAEAEAANPVPVVSEADLVSAVNVLEAAVAHPSLLSTQSKLMRRLRVAIDSIAKRKRDEMYGGTSKEEYKQQAQQKINEMSRRQADKQMDRNYINKTALRASRISRLEVLSKQSDGDLPLVPDGVADAPAVMLVADAALVSLLLENGGAESAAAPSDEAAEEVSREQDDAQMSSAAATALVPFAVGDAQSAAAPARRLMNPRACYVCKVRFRDLHHFYDTLCPRCAALNWKKRHQTADLTGRVALVTGARVKIGFHCALKLLRAGAEVIATSRFPTDAAQRFAALADSGTWAGRLHVFGLDLRDLHTLEDFCAMLLRRFDRLDMIINNACQTVRRPPAYYANLLSAEAAPKTAQPRFIQDVLRAHHFFCGRARRGGNEQLLSLPSSSSSSSSSSSLMTTDDSVDDSMTASSTLSAAASTHAATSLSAAAPAPVAAAAAAAAASTDRTAPDSHLNEHAEGVAVSARELPHSVAMSQVALLPGDALVDRSLFPEGKRVLIYVFPEGKRVLIYVFPKGKRVLIYVCVCARACVCIAVVMEANAGVSFMCVSIFHFCYYSYYSWKPPTV